MNYIDISTPAIRNIYININLNDVAATGEIEWTIYADGNDTPINTFNNDVGEATVTVFNYYHRLALNTSVLANCKDETQYNLVGVFQDNVVYRGKFQTTSKDIQDYSVNENKYTQKTNSTNYTILD